MMSATEAVTTEQQNAIFSAPFLQTPAVLPAVQLSNTDIYRLPASPKHLLFILENVVKVQRGLKKIYAPCAAPALNVRVWQKKTTEKV